MTTKNLHLNNLIHIFVLFLESMDSDFTEKNIRTLIHYIPYENIILQGKYYFNILSHHDYRKFTS